MNTDRYRDLLDEGARASATVQRLHEDNAGIIGRLEAISHANGCIDCKRLEERG